MDNKILIAVDVQNGFLKTPEHVEKAKQIADLAKYGKFDKVIATKIINYTGSMYEKCFNWSALKTPDETDIYSPLKAVADEVFTKTTYNCVNDKFLKLLRCLNHGELPERVYVCGLDTDACILATAIGLFDNNIVPMVLENYCFSTGGENYHKAALTCFERTIGVNQINNCA